MFMIEMKVLQARQGDCIWIRCISDRIVNIVIDAGPSTFKKDFINLVEEIENCSEKIDLLIFSHIDDDHIKGCIQYFKKNDKTIINKVWINGSGSSVYSDGQEHSVNNISDLVSLLKQKNISMETPILEGKEYSFNGGRIKVIGPKRGTMLKVAEKIEKQMEHSGGKYIGDISHVEDIYEADSSDTNKASIIAVLEFEDKKILFTGDSTAENIIEAVNKYYPQEKFVIVKLPHHGSSHNISRELIKKLNTDQFIISTNKIVEKVVLYRFGEERKNTELLCNYDWWKKEYFTENDIKEYINTKRIVMKYIGDEKINL